MDFGMCEHNALPERADVTLYSRGSILKQPKRDILIDVRSCSVVGGVDEDRSTSTGPDPRHPSVCALASF
jgi:hypothetical protein